MLYLFMAAAFAGGPLGGITPGGGGGGGVTQTLDTTMWDGTRPKDTANSHTDYFDTTAANCGSGWSEFDPGTELTVSVESTGDPDLGGLRMVHGANASQRLAGCVKDAPDTDWVATAHCFWTETPIGTPTLWSGPALAVSSDLDIAPATENLATTSLNRAEDTVAQLVSTWNDWNAFSAHLTRADNVGTSYAHVYLRIAWDQSGDTFYFLQSWSGKTWVQLGTGTRVGAGIGTDLWFGVLVYQGLSSATTIGCDMFHVDEPADASTVDARYGAIGAQIQLQ